MLKVMIRNQKIKRTFILGMLFSKLIAVFQSLSDLFFFFQLADFFNFFHLQQSLYAGIHFLQFLNFLTCRPITLFQVSQIGIISFKDIIPCMYIRLLQTIGIPFDATKMNLSALHFSKTSYLGVFL